VAFSQLRDRLTSSDLGKIILDVDVSSTRSTVEH
jgi:hypothetical protein